MNQLHALGYIEPNSTYDGSWVLTSNGHLFAIASAAQPIKRTTADRLVEGLLDRVQIVNTDSKYLYRVSKVHVFGSYLSNQAKIGDINIVVILEQKEPDNTKHVELMVEIYKTAFREGRNFNTVFEGLACSQDEIFMFLKHRSTAIRIIPVEEILDYVDYKTIYEEKKQCRLQIVSKT